MLTYQVIGPLPKYGDFAVGYLRPSTPGQFVPVTVGIPNEKAAYREAQRLAAEAEKRHADAISHRHNIHYARGAFAADIETE